MMKPKPSKSLETVGDSITDFVKKLNNYVLVADLEEEWNMQVIVQIESEKDNTAEKIVKNSLKN